MKIMLAVDGSRYAAAAVRFVGRHFALPHAQVDMVQVLPLVVRPGSAAPRQQREHAAAPAAVRSWLEQNAARLAARGFKVATYVRRGVPARLLPQLAAAGDYDLVVVGAKGRAQSPFLPAGGVALAVLERVPTNVLLVRERGLQRARQVPTALQPFPVIFATDGSAHSTHAAKTFFRFFDIPALRPVALAVAELPEPPTLWQMELSLRDRLVRRIGAVAGQWAADLKPVLARPGIRPHARAVRGRPAPAIIAEALRRDARLIVLGSRGAQDYWGPRLGSVALQVARAAPCSVLIARRN